MFKLKQYIKPYLALLLGAVILLFGQAMLELTLPNYMSDIVNVGLQQGGITSPAPEVIDQKNMQMVKMFLSKEDQQTLESLYREPQDGEIEKVMEKFPNFTENDKVLPEENREEAEGIFSRASYALIKSVEALAPADSMDNAEEENHQAEIDPEAIKAVFMSPEAGKIIEQSIQEAQVTPDKMISQTGIVLTKGVYIDLGADTDAIQNHYIIFDGIKMLGLTLLLTVCSIGAGFFLSRMGAGVGRDLRRDVFAKVTNFNHKEMDGFSTASLITRTTNDIMQIQNFLSMGFRMICFAPIMGIGGLIMGVSTCRRLVWILALALVIMLGLIVVLFKIALPRFKKMQSLVDSLNLVSREELSGIMVVRAFANQKFMQKRFDRASKDLTANTLFVNRAMATMMPIMTFVMNAIMLMIVWFGGKQISQSNMQVGDMMAFTQYGMYVIMSFLTISMMFIMVPRASVSADRINEVLTTENSSADPENPQHLPKDVKGEVEFKDVSFSYEGADANVLEHISFTARPGETTAFIGSTGSGKSTLINLIPRFYDVSSGSITVDGVDIRDMTQKELRDNIGYVPQKGLLFSGTVATNLRYGDKNASDEELRRSAQVAQAEEFIDQLDKGFDTEISQGGTNVSGGQRQRLSIARALVKKAPIYIFDDTFSALDFKTDAKLRKALKEYTKDATVLIVAQRISTIMQAEQIVVLDEGKIVGIGRHEDLMKTCPTYQEIARSQLSKEELA